MWGGGPKYNFLSKRKQGIFFNTKDAYLSIFQSFTPFDYSGPMPCSSSANQSDPVPGAVRGRVREENLIKLFCLILLTAVTGEEFTIII